MLDGKKEEEKGVGGSYEVMRIRQRSEGVRTVPRTRHSEHGALGQKHHSCQKR